MRFLLLCRIGKLRYSLLALLIVGGTLGCSRQPPAAEETPPPAPVKWMEARQMFLSEWTELLGTTQALPDRVARITAPVEGRVLAVLPTEKGRTVREGEPVREGDVIVQLDATLARAALDKAVAAHEELRQQVQQAENAVKLADIERRRQEELYNHAGKPLAAQIDVEKARVAQEDAKSKLEGAKLHVLSGEKELHVLSEQLKLYTLTAPLAGRLGRLQVVPGQTLTPGAPVTDIVDLDKEIDVLCFVPPYTASRLRIGQSARIGGMDDPMGGSAGRTEGKVQFIADQAEVDTGNFAVKVRFPNAALQLRGNITLRLRILTTPGRAALTLPEAAVMEDQDPPMVLVVDDHKQEMKEGKEIETGKARRLRAKLGIHDRVLHLVEILSLDDPEKKWQGDLDTAKFIIEKGQGLSNGDPVKLEVEEDEEAAPEPKP